MGLQTFIRNIAGPTASIMRHTRSFNRVRYTHHQRSIFCSIQRIIISEEPKLSRKSKSASLRLDMADLKLDLEESKLSSKIAFPIGPSIRVDRGLFDVFWTLSVLIVCPWRTNESQIEIPTNNQESLINDQGNDPTRTMFRSKTKKGRRQREGRASLTRNIFPHILSFFAISSILRSKTSG